MMLAEQVAVFYPDLMDERFEIAFAIYHQRYSHQHLPAVVAGPAVPHAGP